jgi:MOSC domain-containing protein YiiM
MRGADLNELIGQDFEVQGLRFHGTEECRPCYWMNRAIAPGAEEFLKGRGGLRAKILSDGKLRSTTANGHPERSEGPPLSSLQHAKEQA